LLRKYLSAGWVKGQRGGGECEGIERECRWDWSGKNGREFREGWRVRASLDGEERT